jgi:hypothetical protein
MNYRTFTRSELAEISQHLYEANAHRRFDDVRPVSRAFREPAAEVCGEGGAAAPPYRRADAIGEGGAAAPPYRMECEREWAQTHWWVAAGLIFGVIFWGSLAGFLAGFLASHP